MQNLILECAVRASLIAICTGAVLHILGVKAARVRHAVWASVVVLMLALPVWTAWGPRAVVRVLKPATAPTVSRSTISKDTSSAQALPQAFHAAMPNPPVRSLAWNWRSCLSGVYLLGFCALLARLATGTVRAHMLVRRAAHCEGRLTSDSCAAPVTVGCLNPTVILPECWRRWPQAQLNAVLTHEGEHARRRDPLVQWLALLNRAVFWFHPLAWWLEFRLSALAEEACDDAVLARGHDPFEYSEYLLQIARAMQRTGARVNVMGMAMPGAFLPQRIGRILEERPAQRISRGRMISVAAACAVVAAVFSAGTMDRAQAQTNGQAVTSAKPIEMPAPAGTRNAIEPTAAHPSPAPPLQRPRVLLGYAQSAQSVQSVQSAPTTPATPNSSAANSTPQDSGSISGTVEDPSGARVPGCAITVRDRSGASVGSAVSNAAGLYQLASIPPGHYNLEYSRPGFARRRMETEIEAGKPVRIDARLELGQISQVVTVTGQKPAAAPAPATAQPAPQPGPISVGGRVENARLLRNSQPIYPAELQQQGVEGTVLIRTVISRDGVPLNPQIVNTDEVDSRFAQAALDAVSQWRYQPAKLNEQPVAVVTSIDVEFRLGK
jgi:TonB family protein